MRADELRIEDLFEIPPDGGVARFGGERTLLYDAVALGLLRAQLARSFGVSVTRALLTRLGYHHGYRIAQAMRGAVAWDDEEQWRIAGGRLHRLQGLVRFEPVAPGRRLDPDAAAEAIWRDSYEAEQHVLHLGRADAPVCWSLAGFASGYLTFTHGEPVFCVEERCVGRGDACCHMVGRLASRWGDRLEEVRAPYQEDCLDASTATLVEDLRRLEAQLARARRAASEGEVERGGIVARSGAMRRVLALVDKAAKVDATVLITGESGVGKERVARLLHDESGRRGGPYVAVNCGALPEALLESELFGHAKGAFTGASAARAGLFEAAQGGSLFLDEIGELPLGLQVKLLRVLQEREVRRLGENHPRPVDARVLAATNRHLAARVAEGAFREDLYYRLQVIEIAIPPLRERLDDVLPLARATLADASARMGREPMTLGAGAARALLAHPWPGNVRELANAMERAAVFAEGVQVRAEDLGPLQPEPARQAAGRIGFEPRRTAAPSPRPPPTPTAPLRLADVERDHILHVLRAHGGRRAPAARALGISEATLFRRLRAYRDAGHDA